MNQGFFKNILKDKETSVWGLSAKKSYSPIKILRQNIPYTNRTIHWFKQIWLTEGESQVSPRRKQEEAECAACSFRSLLPSVSTVSLLACKDLESLPVSLPYPEDMWSHFQGVLPHMRILVRFSSGDFLNYQTADLLCSQNPFSSHM